MAYSIDEEHENKPCREAREVIKRYAITDENYEEAVKFLQNKYGDTSKLIDKLQRRLESAKAEGTGISAQRRLLEYIIPTISQLEKEKVSLNGSYRVRKILAKFNASLQHAVLTTPLSQNISETEWSMQQAVQLLDQLISTEERISDMVTKSSPGNERTN
uniref:DUF4145 domain-containing protein n=1 Tax=Haemonchus contortus TaxID=6289 RepID=A0A7I4YN27_HAECO